MYIALIAQDTEGCSYTIACGKKWIELESTNINSALLEMKRIVLDNYRSSFCVVCRSTKT